MASEESFVILVHHRGSIKRKTRSGVKFTDKDPLCIVVTPRTSYDDLVRSVLMKLRLEDSKRDTVKYDCFTISSDEDLQVMFLCRQQFPEVRTPELLAKLVNVVSSSGGSNRNTTTLATPAGSSSRPAVASSSVPVYQPVVHVVASSSFAVDLNGSVGDDVGSRENLPDDLLDVAPLGVGDGVLGDADEDDVEPDMIDDDSGDDIRVSEPALAVGSSSTGTQQYPPHFSSLDLNAMRQEGVSGHSVGFGARDAEGTAGLTKFQYKVVEFDYRRYVGKCSDFGNGCTWLIRLESPAAQGHLGGQTVQWTSHLSCHLHL
ncbi:hypothetical protein Ahy_A06g029548 isoform C [Arachis hypogaea]|uniref:Transposase MuDR plant domain-containing protein n=1 Tax=Arachis hypogaea TaxID=3818 RepID=A0A445CTN5_ARAHY|nr:hypothetical protein Ahy_A06g029548 isoform C [Arachis hypogaea]